MSVGNFIVKIESNVCGNLIIFLPYTKGLVLIEPLIQKIIAPIWARHEKSSYLYYEKKLQEDQYVSSDERKARQWEKLKKLIHFVWQGIPFYNNRFKQIGFQPQDLKTWDDYFKLPLLKKIDIQNNVETLLNISTPRNKLIPKKTSGSTGVSLDFFVTEEEFQYKRAIAFYRDQWSGWRLGEWRSMVWGNPEYIKSFRGILRNTLLEREFYLDTLKMDRKVIDSFIHTIFRKKPTMLFGHAHSLYLLAQHWEKYNFPSYQFKGMISTAMVLHDFERKKCEDIFHSKMFDRYGCEEVSLIASECEAHTGLHINTDSLIVEIKSDVKEKYSVESSPIIVTDLTNYTFPFIRYEVGDMGILSSKECPCGRTYPILSKVAGRIADYLQTPQGDWVSGISLTENFATLISGVSQIQIVQEKMRFLFL